VRGAYISLWIVPLLAGCATTSDAGQVKEVSPGTYSIGVAHGSSSVAFGGTEGAKEGVDRAGQFCHAKGQKLVILPDKGKDVTFQCREKLKPDEQ
jgi:hypothetical protein